MSTRNTYISYLFFLIFGVLTISSSTIAETLYLDSRSGNDSNPGSEDKSIKTFQRATELVNSLAEAGPTTLIVAPGVYTLTGTVLFQNARNYTEEDRLTIRAKILPDEPGWRPELMPILLCTEIPEQVGKTNEVIENTGLKIELNHVTIRGLKFLGSPVPRIWYYPIFREGKDLKDLIITQCIFSMESYAVTCNVGVLANGHGLVIDHCIFYNCRNPVVYWRAEEGISYGNAMRYCLVEGAYTSGVWVCDTAEDFDFHHNIITQSNFAWMRDAENRRKYRLHDCIITENKHYSGECGANWKLSQTGSDIVFEEKNVRKEGEVILEKGNGIDVEIPNNFLHVMPGTLGSDLGAGLFIITTQR
jgi:hypothetical protein